MIDDKTIKSLYDDKPTLLEWLKRVEAQLEELKKVTNFDALTANNVEVKEDAIIGGMLNGNMANFNNSVSFQNGASVMNDFYVNNKSVCRNIYVHQITWDLFGTNVTKRYLSTKPTPYASMADLFGHRNDTNLSTAEVAEYSGESALLTFSSTGEVLSAIAFAVRSDGSVAISSMAPEGFNSNFVKDEVLGGWGA